MSELLSYENLDILFERDGDAYRVRVTHAPGGADVPEQAFEVPFDDRDLENFVLKLAKSKGRVRRIDSPEIQGTKEVGGKLFDALFTRGLATCLAMSRDHCHTAGEGLRLRLNLTETPSLLNLPWEFLYDRSINRFLSLSDETPIVRYLAVDHPANPLKTPLPLRVLVMVSSPDDVEYQDLDVEKEIADLKKAVASLAANGHLFLDVIPATLDDLRRALSENRYQVFHFIGHGGFDPSSQDGALVLETEGGRASITSGPTLGTFLADHRPLRLAVLNACEGARSANDDPFAGVAQTLIQQGVPAVVAMQFEITDRAAIAFSKDFYASLVLGLPVDVAVSEARKGIFAQNNATEWATPVLYLRSPDGVLFDIEYSDKIVRDDKRGDDKGGDDKGWDDKGWGDNGGGENGGGKIEEDPRAILEPLRRTPTLLLLGFAMVALGLVWLFWARSVDSNFQPVVAYSKARDYVAAFGWGLGAAATYLGAYFVGRSAGRVTSNTRLLLIGGISSTVTALGLLMLAIGDSGSQSPTFLNISRGFTALGILVIGFLCFVLAKQDRSLRVGSAARSPVGPLVLAGIGIWLYTAQIYPGFTWVVTSNQFDHIKQVSNIVSGVGFITLSAAFVLIAVYRAGPVTRLLTAAVALLVLGLMTIVHVYSVSWNAFETSAYLICLSYFCLAIVFFLSPLRTSSSRKDVAGDRDLIPQA
jgi:hypothetical protein